MYFGKKGCGKTTHICKTAFKYLKKGKDVYCTEYIPGTHYISYEDAKDIGKYQYPRGAVIFIDEVGMLWHKREFKSFNKETRNWFKLQRHFENTVYLYSQIFDPDSSVRDLVDIMYFGKSYFNCISIFKKIKKDLVIVHPSGDSEARITDDLQVVPFLVPFSRQISWMPKYHKYYNSFGVPDLPYRDMPLMSFHDDQLKWYHRKHFRVQMHFWMIKLKCLVERFRIYYVVHYQRPKI